ncbi:uncharacterized protein LOC120431875 [Culex pipiens pallens]|uniref:uncharacterized protein LOC120431875 n=1 Tax=Culex pipiens pallens TaxID=42434 RepID=UPI001954B625|nr:uncharacterized protein LOC120431875 [Culex pipiens pallens]
MGNAYSKVAYRHSIQQNNPGKIDGTTRLHFEVPHGEQVPVVVNLPHTLMPTMCQQRQQHGREPEKSDRDHPRQPEDTEKVTSASATVVVNLEGKQQGPSPDESIQHFCLLTVIYGLKN